MYIFIVRLFQDFTFIYWIRFGSMDTIEKLEKSVHSLIKEHDSLRSELARVDGDTTGTLNELEEAKVTIAKLNDEISELNEERGRNKKTDQKKIEIIRLIHTIVEKIEKFNKIDKVTNV